MVSEFFRIDTYLDPAKRDEFIHYNKMDVDYCVKLDRGFKDVNTGEWKEYRFIQSFWGEKNFVGLHDINFTLEHIKRHDCLWLRKAHELGMVLPSAPEEQSEEDLEYGGVVFTPPPKIYPNLVVLDMSRYYPSILRSYPMQTSPDIWGKLGPAVINYLLAEREVWDAEVLKHEPGTAQWKVVKDTRDKVKTFLSGSWGYFAFKGSRIFSKEKADFVLKTAGDGLHRLQKRAEAMGFAVVYGDTDSIFLDCPMGRVPELEVAMNDELQKWAEENGIGETAKFKIKEDRYASESLFIKKKGKDTGAKKRYAQHIIREDGRACDYVLIKGFDYIRGNTSEITRKLQKECIEMVLRGKGREFAEKLGKLMADIRSGNYDLDQITIPVNLSLNWNRQEVSGEYYAGAI
jgi:DNA polymerase-2